ncbi:hypothetical protein DH09_02485 [Bacillaceae bacterium JMAK1]|nr:hypothetical protein DH09_02485 [Bacillaceae bacterium JMAK1]
MNNDTQTTDELLVVTRENVCYVTFQRPTYYNAFTPSLLQSLTTCIEDADRNEHVRAIVITGAGKAFCSGQDLKAMKSEETYDQLLENNYHPLLRVMRSAKTPLIAAVNGTAAGAGMSLALACDYRLVQRNTSFISAFTNIGLVPDAGMMYDLPRLVGSAKAFEIATLNAKISGEEAVALHLATRYIHDDWHEGVEQFAKTIAAMPTEAIQLTKELLFSGLQADYETYLNHEARAQLKAGNTSDHKEGLQAFKEKRTPQFTGL